MVNLARGTGEARWCRRKVSLALSMKALVRYRAAAALCQLIRGLSGSTPNGPGEELNPETMPPGTAGAPNQAQNPMPGATGGFNNNEINGKSRNPDTMTPGTGPANANPTQNQ